VVVRLRPRQTAHLLEVLLEIFLVGVDMKGINLLTMDVREEMQGVLNYCRLYLEVINGQYVRTMNGLDQMKLNLSFQVARVIVHPQGTMGTNRR
jgi:hypothetical protein